MATTKLLSCVLLLSYFLISSLCLAVMGAPQRTSRTSTIKQYLDPHNKVRFQHGLPPLQWSAKLVNFAKWYGNRRRKDCALIHSPGFYGENLFWGSGKNWQPADAVSAWAAEESDYDYKNNRCVGNRQCLHYTQLVWKTTKQVGCAKIICGVGDSFIICNYYPHGNYIGQRPY